MDATSISSIAGAKVIYCNHACNPEYELVKRTWGERLFTRPWNPRTKFKQVLKALNPQMYRLTPPGGVTVIVAHPAFSEQLRNLASAEPHSANPYKEIYDKNQRDKRNVS